MFWQLNLRTHTRGGDHFLFAPSFPGLPAATFVQAQRPVVAGWSNGAT